MRCDDGFEPHEKIVNSNGELWHPQCFVYVINFCCNCLKTHAKYYSLPSSDAPNAFVLFLMAFSTSLRVANTASMTFKCSLLPVAVAVVSSTFIQHSLIVYLNSNIVFVTDLV